MADRERHAGGKARNPSKSVLPTIIETLEVPRLEDIEGTDFVRFRQLRKEYEKLVAEKTTKQACA